MSSIILPVDRTTYHNLIPKRGIFYEFILHHARAWMSLALAVSDISGLILSGLLAFWLYDQLSMKLIEPVIYLRCIPVTLFFIGVFALRGLYPAIGLSSVEELRLLTINTSMVFVAITASSFWLHTENVYSRLVFLLTWLFSLAMIPAGRILVRVLLANFHLWGEPVVIIGPLQEARQVVEELRAYPRMGRYPAVIINTSETIVNNGELLVLPPSEMVEFIHQHRIHTALVIFDDLNALPLVRDTYRDVFERVPLCKRTAECFTPERRLYSGFWRSVEPGGSPVLA